MGLPPVQSFPQHLLYFILSSYQYFSMFQSCGQVSLPCWSVVRQSGFQEVDVEALLAWKCGVIRINVMLDSCAFQRVFCMFAARKISKGKTIGAKYGSLVYTDIFKQLLSIKEYRKGTVEVYVRTAGQCATALPNTPTDRRGVHHLCWIEQTCFDVMG